MLDWLASCRGKEASQPGGMEKFDSSLKKMVEYDYEQVKQSFFVRRIMTTVVTLFTVDQLS